jgi:hypothetical protein
VMCSFRCRGGEPGAVTFMAGAGTWGLCVCGVKKFGFEARNSKWWKFGNEFEIRILHLTRKSPDGVASRDVLGQENY